MAFIYGDPNTAGPFASYQIKDVVVKVIKLTFANFTTAGVNAFVAQIPADASILGFETWVKTALNNGATSPTISLGTAAAGTQFASAVAITNTIGTQALVSPVAGILQEYNPPYTADIPLWVRGACSTANPTAGEIYLVIKYVR